MLQHENLDLLLNDAGAPGFEILYWIIANPFYILPGLHGEVYLQSTGHHSSTRDQVSDPFSVALSLMIGVKLMHIDSSVGGVVVADTVCSLRRPSCLRKNPKYGSYFLRETSVQFWDMFDGRRMVEQVEAGSIFTLRMLAHSARGDTWSSYA